MAFWDIGLKHIIDIDGQLLAIDAEIIDPASLLKRADLPTDRSLCLVRAGELFTLHPQRSVRLSRDEVLFFETRPAVQAETPLRLAA